MVYSSKISDLKFLWFTWRDIHNPEHGGAEIFGYELAKRLVKNGHKVTFLTSEFNGCSQNETIDGIEIIRSGGKYSVYKNLIKLYRSQFFEKYDIIIDEINTKPFGLPKYVGKEKLVALIHQLAREFWLYETKFPLNYLGYYFLENYWLKKYINIPTITVSQSTKSDLLKIGFKDVSIVHNGFDFPKKHDLRPKYETPTLIFLGRLKKNKRPKHALLAFKKIQNKIPQAKMYVVGTGPLQDTLMKQGWKNVIFSGQVNEKEKSELLSKSHIILVTGIREGWGRIVTEANSYGTPAIAYNVHGLRDSIQHNYSGLLVKNGDIDSLASEAVNLFKNKKRLDKLSQNCLEHASQYTWEHTYKEFISKIKSIL